MSTWELAVRLTAFGIVFLGFVLGDEPFLGLFAGAGSAAAAGWLLT